MKDMVLYPVFYHFAPQSMQSLSARRRRVYGLLNLPNFCPSQTRYVCFLNPIKNHWSQVSWCLNVDYHLVTPILTFLIYTGWSRSHSSSWGSCQARGMLGLDHCRHARWFACTSPRLTSRGGTIMELAYWRLDWTHIWNGPEYAQWWWSSTCVPPRYSICSRIYGLICGTVWFQMLSRLSGNKWDAPNLTQGPQKNGMSICLSLW